ncbi:MAG: GNAT family N-acetyltransferase [Legionella longbeachae]|nr:GNAT family N-acetyltransferase [Legionella longbeachae]
MKETVMLNNSLLEELKQFPLQAVIWGILENTNKDRIVALPNNSILLMEESDDPFVFIAGKVIPETIDAAIALTANAKYPMIYCQPKYHHLFLKRNWDFHLRAEMKLNKAYTPLSIEDSFVIQPIDSIDFFKKCLWFKETSDRYGSAEQFLKFGSGYALCKNGHIISECYTDYLGGG